MNISISILINQTICNFFEQNYQVNIPQDKIVIQKTKPEFEGDFTLVCFGFTPITRKSPDITANEIGEFLTNNCEFITDFNVIKGFLNLTIANKYWIDFACDNISNAKFGFAPELSKGKIVIEFSSPNTNKPLHLGHVRNNLLGHSIAAILSADGFDIKKVNLINDRGIHICKSMLAWLKWGNGETPATSGLKGDHLIGKYYVLFDQKYKAQIAELEATGIIKEIAEKQAPLIIEAQEMLVKWENNDSETRKTWELLNSWVYDGFEKTYQQMGIEFDKIYYESNTYTIGKSLVQEGLQSEIFNKKEDGSVWVDLTSDGLDEKLLLRGDGTSVYMTQDLGTAQLRHNDFLPEKMIYVVGNEQNYHFDVLKLILFKKMGLDWAGGIKHLSYGMVELPSGKMKSREGTVVDADELMDEMISDAKAQTIEKGKIDQFTTEEAQELFKTIGLGALKYFILKVDPKKNMMFNPEQSIDLTGNTAPFIQYTHARISSLLDKACFNSKFALEIPQIISNITIEKSELEILRQIHEFPTIISESSANYSPALLANYIYDLVKLYNSFYQEKPILKEEDESKRLFRIAISQITRTTIKNGMKLLGIEVPNKM
jgi:arginyl-tRNA synthetase